MYLKKKKIKKNNLGYDLRTVIQSLTMRVTGMAALAKVVEPAT